MLRTLKRYFITFILLFVFVSILPHTVQASESNNGTKILHKVNTSRPNFPTRYNISLNKESDIFFEIRTNERSTVGWSIKNQQDEISVLSDTLPSTDPNWVYNKSNGTYKNTHKIHLTAGTFILELNFEGEVNYDLTISLIPDKAKLNYSKLTITKGFSKQLKADGGKIKSCNSSNQSIASVNNKGKIFAKKNGTTTISVQLTNGQKLLCRVKVVTNEFNKKQITLTNTLYNTYAMKAYNAHFDSKGNIVVKFKIVNNNYGKIDNIDNFNINIKNAKKTTMVSYTKSNYKVTVKGYGEKACTMTIPKSAFKVNKKQIDLRTAKFTISGDVENGSF